ncbi:MAG: S9 family peptidase [Saprospiraceae bacterium]|nr:S9 family peptidase [Saprospiraceae bacterium]
MRYLFITAFLIGFIACNTEQAPTPPKQYSIDAFYQNTRIGGGAFSDDESKILVSSDTSGIFNVYEIDIATAEMTARTNSEDESYFAVDYVPGTNDIIYSADKGGDEINHLYLHTEAGETTDLTPAENEKANFGGWSTDNTHMYYASNKRDPRFFDLYKMKIGEWEPTMIYENTDGLNLSDMSDDERYFALEQSITTSENKLFIHDSETGERVEISSDDAPGSYSSSSFSKDGSKYYYITDIGEEFAYLVEYDMATQERNTILKTDWDVMYSYLSENEKYRVSGINEDGKNNLIITNIATGEKVDFPEIEDGDISAVRISDSETKMRLTIATSKGPSNIYVYDMETKDLKKLTNTLNPDINPDDLVSAEVVRYPSFDGLEIPAIYYKPITASPDNKVPALVWVHGGPGGQSRTGYFSLIQYLVNHGYAVLAVNNRGSSGYGKSFYKMDDLNHGDKDLKDCIWGKKWLQEQDYIDSDRIGIIGGSYGGYMVMAALAFAPEEFNVGVNIFGVTNWLRTLKSIPPYWESFRKALYAELGDPTTQDSVRLYEISPLFHASNVTKPLMVLQGANDPRVLQVESDEIVEAVKGNGVPVEYVVFEDEGHGFVKKENEIQGYGQILTFLDKYLKNTVAD